MELTLLPFRYEFVKRPDFIIKDEVIKGQKLRHYWLIWLRWELIVTRRMKA